MDMQPIVRHRRSAIVGLWQKRPPLDGDVLARMGQARVYLKNGHVDRAKAVVDALQPLAPLDPKLLQLRAECNLATGDYLDAIALFDRGLAQSDQAVLWAGKGKALKAMKRLRQAAACFQRASALDQDVPEYLCDAAECLLHAGQPKDAEQVLETAISGQAVNLLRAKILRELGQGKAAFQTAIAAISEDQTGTAVPFARQIASTPQDHGHLSQLCAPMVSDPDVRAQARGAALPSDRPYLAKSTLVEIETKAAQNTTPPDQKAALNHILFRHHNYIDARDTAQFHLGQFHKHTRAATPYRRSHDSALFTVLKRLRFTTLPSSKSSILPIFVTGLPGSGRSYARQLLQSSARQHPARPLHLVDAMMTRFMRQLRQTGARDVSRDDLMGLQSELRAGLLQAAHDSEIVIDSNMLNFRWSGLIAAALPEARIVHITRDAMQTGWAMHSRALDGINLGCRHDLNDLSVFQNQSEGLMRHWEHRFGSSIIAVSGDALLRSSGQTARAMIDACHLKWSGNCVSAPPARQPDWYRYADLLAPLRNTHDANDTTTPM
jgi:tetratricopeptide (TPR) repeat protein